MEGTLQDLYDKQIVDTDTMGTAFHDFKLTDYGQECYQLLKEWDETAHLSKWDRQGFQIPDLVESE